MNSGKMVGALNLRFRVSLFFYTPTNTHTHTHTHTHTLFLTLHVSVSLKHFEVSNRFGPTVLEGRNTFSTPQYLE